MKKYMRIYLPFATNSLKQWMAYKGSFYLFMVIGLFSSFISYYLWMAIYGSSNNTTLGGMTQNEMVVYVFMVYVTSALVSSSISGDISQDVVKGTVAMNLIKPIDYRMSLISKALGTMVFSFVAPVGFVWIGLEIYKGLVLHMAPPSLAVIGLYLLSGLMSFLIYVLFDFCFGMLAFFTTYIFGMQMAKDALLVFLTGQLIPISFFPEVIQKIFGFLPFTSMVYTPVMIYLGKYTGQELQFVLARQLVWVVVLYLLGSFIWNKATKRLVILGG